MQILTTALWRIATPVEAGAIHPISFPHSVSVTLASTLSAQSGPSLGHHYAALRPLEPDISRTAEILTHSNPHNRFC